MKPWATVAAALLLALPGVAAAPSHHDDYARAATSDAALRDAANAFLGGGAVALRLAAAGSWTEARQQADAALAQAQAVIAANDVDSPGVDRPGIGMAEASALAPLEAQLAELLRSSQDALNASRPAETRILAVAELDTLTNETESSLVRLDALGFDTTDLRAALVQLRTVVDAASLPPPPQPPRDAQGRPSVQLTLQPPQAMFNHTVQALVVGPPGAGVTLTAFGTPHAATLNGAGLATLAFRVPWSADRGTTPVTAGTAQAQATRLLVVIPIPTQFTGARYENDGPRRIVRGTLMDADGHAMYPSLVAWSTNATALQQRSGSTPTAPSGAFRIGPEPPSRIVLEYAGNRTHGPAHLDLLDDQATGALTEAGRIEDQFHRVGQAAPAVAPVTPWPLIFAIALALAGAVLLEVEDLGARLQPRRVERALQRAAERATGRRKPPHPLLAMIERFGEDPSAMTLREAEERWRRMQAPMLHPWLDQHERAYYEHRHIVVPPPRLMDWARRGGR